MQEKPIIAVWGQENEYSLGKLFPSETYQLLYNEFTQGTSAQVVLPSAVLHMNWQKFQVPTIVHNLFAENIHHPLAVHTIWWQGLHAQALEASASLQVQELVKNLLPNIPWQWSPFTPGLVGARTIAMIVNEAFFALEENVANKADIDTAMRLGTNYPFGPFEWAEKIGLQNIASLLQFLAKENSLYTPCNLLIQQANELHDTVH